VRGWDSVTVPGAVAAWVALSERFGILPFADLLAPAIEVAERGYAVPVIVQQKWVAAAPLLGSLPGWAEAFLPHGRPPERRRALRLPGGGTRAEGDRGDARRGVLRRRDR
jgi:gamma-glutamyltranspeptidase/glutathione hydrolase